MPIALTTVMDLPGLSIDLQAVALHAATLTKVGSGVQGATSAIASTWSAVPQCFEATGTDPLYSVMGPVQVAGDAVQGSLAAAAKALDAYAADVVPTLRRIDALRTAILAFQNTVVPSYPKDGTPVEGVNVHTQQATAVTTPHYATWADDPAAVDMNHEHRLAAARLTAELIGVQQTCATAIRAAAGLPAFGTAAVRAEMRALATPEPNWSASAAIADAEPGCAGSTNRMLNGVLSAGVYLGMSEFADVLAGVRSFGDAMVQHPDEATGLVGGLLLTALGGAVEGAGVGLDITVGGAIIGVPANVLGGTIIGAGVTAVGLNGGQLFNQAAGEDAVAPEAGASSGDEGSGAGGDAVGPTADSTRAVLAALPRGTGSARVVSSDEELNALYDELSSGGKSDQWQYYPGRAAELPDGTRIGLRRSSKSGGATIDVRYPNGKTSKVHVQQ